MNLRLSSLIRLSVLVFIIQVCAFGQVQVADLRCEYAVDPLGVDVAHPGLGWRIESDGMGQKQTAYQIVVASSLEKLKGDEGDLWDSGKVSSGQTLHIPYSGSELQSGMECHWKVRVWDKDGSQSEWSAPSKWVMGMLNPGDWTAKWIKAPHPKLDGLKIISATYGDSKGKETIDVKELLEALLEQNKPITVSSKTFGGGKKANNYVLNVEYELKGTKHKLTVNSKDVVAFDEQSRKGKAAPHFRKAFVLNGVPDSARITVNAAAFFELFVNGEKVGQDVLTPAIAAVKKRSFSVTYDIQPYLKKGNNCIGLWVGHWDGPFSNEVKVRAQLAAVVNGKPFALSTDESWETRNSGRYTTKSGSFGGELVDARELVPDWSLPGSTSKGWSPAVVDKGDMGKSENQSCPLNRIGKVIPAVSVKAIGKGLYEIDFGTALTGWCRLKMPRLQPGTTVTMTFADNKSPDQDSKMEKLGVSGWYQTFGQVSRFISAGQSDEVFQHRFNYAAFRYVVVEGLPAAPKVSDATAMLVESDLEPVGAFECSNELLNRIFDLNEWTLRCLNLGGQSVDCPHRERKGYGGDGQTPVEGVMTGFRADGFFRKWLTDWKHVQKADGSLPNTAPQGFGGGGPAWGGFVAAVTWRHYLYYGDRRVLEENYDTVRKYVEYMEEVSRNNGDILTGKTGRFSFIGDWVAPGRGMDSKNMPSHEAREIFNNCYRIYHLQLYMKMAHALGKDAEVAKYQKVIEKIRPIIHKQFYDADSGTYVYDQQAYYILPLMTGVVPEALRSKVLKDLEKNILVTRDGHLDTGLLGTYFLLEYLREIGRSDLLFTIFNQTTYPGWGYMLEQGATTVWEQWNGHWSHIHSCFPSANNWLYQGLGGIQADPAGPGFKKFIVKPEIVGDVIWVKAYHDSPYGRIVSNWKREEGSFTMKVTVPPNSTGTVYVPATSSASVMVNGKAVAKNAYVTFIRQEQGRFVFNVEPGTYTIVSKWDD
ncbi:hypothetical protein PDESU_01835 [Pontiella desulfatans]|uniref:alpha-L-rhamnosidase n=1 Tax=Pontiella desulfatans TaxID=2750659 RepID=A0A6C2U0D4_PONDE|nr:family 78 glycoside hydrolase catalytic domain [Pontiella desulfatans]VGO13279.1 hypothetical protein PDESU_01835 [Pontiella desulfatans]